jgi:hypothetical protein
VAPSGIVLPGEENLALTQVVKGLYVVEGASTQEVDFFAQPAMYRKGSAPPERNAEREPPATPANR